MIQLILIIIKIQIMEIQRKKIRQKKEKNNSESDHSETDERYQTENKELVIRKENQKEGDYDDLVNTDTDLETNNEGSK